MNYHHLTIEERACLREYYKKGYSYRKIAELIGRNVSTVSRELRRNCTHMYNIPTYYPHTAQKKIPAKKVILSPRNVSRPKEIGVYQETAIRNMVSGTNIKYALRNGYALNKNDLSMDLRKVHRCKSKGAAKER